MKQFLSTTSCSLQLYTVLLLVLLQASIVLSSCDISYKLGCSRSPRSATSTVTFLDIGGEPEYNAAITFHWGPSDTELGSKTYTSGEEIVEGAEYSYDENGAYYMGYTIHFGEGSDCEGKTKFQYYVLTFPEDTSADCEFVKYDGTDVPTMIITDSPTTISPITSSPTTSLPSKKTTPVPTFFITSEPTPQPTISTPKPTPRPFLDIITPQCGDDICDEDEHNEMCPVDCEGIILDTDLSGNGSNPGDWGYAAEVSVQGTMFSISSTRDAIIKSLDVYSNTVGVERVEIFMKVGVFEEYESNSDAWNTVYNNYPNLQGSESPTTLNLNNALGLAIRANTLMSFFIHSVAEIRCYEGEILARDNVLEIKEGMEMNEKWTGNAGGVTPLSFRGAFRYDVVKEIPVTSSPTLTPTLVDNKGSEKTISPTKPGTRQPTPLPTTISTPLSSVALVPDATVSPMYNPVTPMPIAPGATDAPPATSPTALSEQKYNVMSKMVLYHSELLNQDSKRIWRDVTENTIHDEVMAMLGYIDSQLVTVDVKLYEQNVLEASRMRMLRNLQTSSASQLELEFTSMIQFPSETSDWDANQMVASGFQTVDKQNAYINDLKEKDDGSYFESLAAIALEVDGKFVTETAPTPTPVDNGAGKEETGDGNDDGGNNSVYVYVAGAVGGALFLAFILAMISYAKRRQSKHSREQEAEATKSSTSPDDLNVNSNTTQQRQQPNTSLVDAVNTPPPPQQPTMSSYFGTIESGEVDDVSMISDPYFGDAVNANGMDADHTVGESIISSQQQLQFYGAGKPHDAASQMGGSTIYSGTPSKLLLFKDDNTMEDIYKTPEGNHTNGTNFQRIIINAPAGKLGIVLDNPNLDFPVVHAIKETSALHGKIRVGDLLLSVDGVDCQGMSTHTVSVFLSSRSQKFARMLVFARAGSAGVNGTVVV